MNSTLEYLHTVLYYIGIAGAHITRDDMTNVVQTTLADKGSEMMQTVAQQWIAEGIERGIERGVAQGRVQALQEAILDLLQVRYSVLPTGLTAQVMALTHAEFLRLLLREAAVTDSMAEFSQRLAHLASEPPRPGN